jgi:hypothetical protein
VERPLLSHYSLTGIPFIERENLINLPSKPRPLWTGAPQGNVNWFASTWVMVHTAAGNLQLHRMLNMIAETEQPWNFHQPNIPFYSARPRYLSNGTFSPSASTTKSPASSFSHGRHSASSSQPTLFDTARSTKVENEESSRSNDCELGLSLESPKSEKEGFFDEYLDYETHASRGVQSALEAKELSTQPPTVSPSLVLASKHSSNLFSSQQPLSTPQMSDLWLTSTLPIQSYSSLSSLDTPTSNPLLFPNAPNSWTHRSLLSDLWMASSLPYSSHQSRPALVTSMANPQMFSNAKYPWTQAPSMYHTTSSSFGESAMPPHMRDRFSFPDIDVPMEFPSYPSLDASLFHMNDISSLNQSLSTLAAGPRFPRPVDMAVVTPHPKMSREQPVMRQPEDFVLGTPKHTPPVHGFYSNQMRKEKKIRGGKTNTGKTTKAKTTRAKSTRAKSTRTRNVTPNRETLASLPKRTFEKTGRGEGEEAGDGDRNKTRSRKRQKR